LTPSPKTSSSQMQADQIMAELTGLGVKGETVLSAAHDDRHGIDQDMGDGDEWPRLREKVMAADILLVATPIWLGHPASLCQRVLERLNADIS
ncbi:NAD(P)H-dependent oxidoreductase, partial [Streptomyces sp. DT225]